MADVFLKIVNMSISASWLVLAVFVFRLVFKKAPKWIHVLLWGIVAVRLLCPFSIESALSLIPSAETISPEIMMSQEPTIHTGVPAINSVVNPIITETFAPEPVASANPLQIWIPVVAMIWGIGVLLLLAYTAISYWRLHRRVCTAVLLRDNIFQSEAVSSPFVLGIIKPKIYLTFNMDGQNLEHVVSHEQAHIRRRDHWWKPLGFLLLTIHWFNPLMWLAYVLLCRDIELACDEKVIKELGNEQRADYSQALLACSINHRMIAACPLAFGEVGVKERVRSVLNYKKPAFWVIAVSVIACVVVAVCFLTNPQKNPENLPTLEQTYLAISSKGEEFDVGLTGHSRDSLIDFWGEPDGMLSGLWGDIWELNGLANVIVYYDQNGNIEHIKIETAEDHTSQASPIIWTYSPMMSATWHAAFHFNFDMNYSHIEASCDEGELWNPRALGEGQPHEKSLRFEAGQPVCWRPSIGETLEDTATEAQVSFTVYDGGEILYTGKLDIVRTGTENGQSFYEARLGGTDLLAMRQEEGNMGATLSLSDSAAIVAFTDLNHNHVSDQIVVREVHTGMLYELAVMENGTKIWSTEASPAHTGWNTIMLYSEGGQDYLVQYLPAMFQGVGSYTCTVFSLEGNQQTVKEEWAVDFELPVEETPEMEQFAKEIGVLLRNCNVLLSTEQGIVVNQYFAASALPQLYPVRFDPDEIQAAIDGATNIREPGFNAAGLPEAPIEFLFASGAGGWGTTLILQPDGNFTGRYSDADMGSGAAEYPNGTYYVCDFSGQFTDIQQINDYAWFMKLKNLTTKKQGGEIWIENQTRYIASDPHGLTDGKEFILYAPGTPADELPAEFRDWWPNAYHWRNGELEQLDGWGLCNVNTGHGFFQSTTNEQTTAGKALTDEEIVQINEVFNPIVYDKQGNPIGVNPWSCFFTSYYDDVRNLNFAEFLRYFPGDGSTVDETEFAALKELDSFLFHGEVSTLENMPVPVHKYPRRIIDVVLKEYAGITTEDLDTSGVEYLADYDAFYNYTSDFGPGMFTCTRGEVIGDIVRLYEEFEFGTDMLTLRKVGNNYQVVAHQCIEGNNATERIYG